MAGVIGAEQRLSPFFLDRARDLDLQMRRINLMERYCACGIDPVELSTIVRDLNALALDYCLMVNFGTGMNAPASEMTTADAPNATEAQTETAVSPNEENR